MAADPALAGDHRFVQAGPFPGRGQDGGVGRIRPHVGGCGVPGLERARIQQRGQHLTRLHPAPRSLPHAVSIPARTGRLQPALGRVQPPPSGGSTAVL